MKWAVTFNLSAYWVPHSFTRRFILANYWSTFLKAGVKQNLRRMIFGSPVITSWSWERNEPISEQSLVTRNLTWQHGSRYFTSVNVIVRIDISFNNWNRYLISFSQKPMGLRPLRAAARDINGNLVNFVFKFSEKLGEWNLFKKFM